MVFNADILSVHFVLVNEFRDVTQNYYLTQVFPNQRLKMKRKDSGRKKGWQDRRRLKPKERLRKEEQ